MAIKFPARCKHTTSTTGTGTYTLSSSAAPAGYRLLSRAITDGDLVDGDTVHYIVVDTTVVGGVKLLEMGSGVYALGANTLTRATIYQPGGAAVNWGAGTRDVYIIDNPLAFMVGANNLSDIANASSARTALGLGTSAVLDVGTTASKVVQLTAAGKYPAVDGSLITGLPGSPFTAGDKILFYQSSASAGWTKITTLDDKLIMVTSSAGINPTGGTTGGIGGWDNSWGITVGNHTLTTSEIPAHHHIVDSSSAHFVTHAPGSGFLGMSGGSDYGWAAITGSDYESAGGSHTHTISSSSQWRPPTIYMILCSKN